MYELARGPLMWITAIVFFAGIGYRVFQIFRLTEKKERAYSPTSGVREDSGEERKLRLIVYLQNTLFGQHPVMASVSLVFHGCLVVAPVFSRAHNLLWRESWGLAFYSLPDGVIDVMTAIVLLGALFFFVRRLFVPRVRAISTLTDHLVLFIVAAPFLTGFIAYHQWVDSKFITTLHILTGQLMLIAIPFTKVGHMVFFIFARTLFGSEFSLWRGSRKWST